MTGHRLPPPPLPQVEIIGECPRVQEVRRLIQVLGAKDIPTLVAGETGTGKELVARGLHVASLRAARGFVPVNCAALPESLIESELFGHERGAFTGASHAKAGLVEAAPRGTLFLDEIGEVPLHLQAKLLRFLDSGEYRRVGGTGVRHADVRVVAATNRDLKTEVAAGRFRMDLYMRLGRGKVRLPPLRERGDDVTLLALHFLESAGQTPARSFSQEALQRLRGYAFPGNVRELRNVVEEAALCDDEVIGADRLPEEVRAEPSPTSSPEQGSVSELVHRMTLAEVERRHILEVYRETGQNRTKTAQILGIDVKTLRRKLESYE